jgi:hypothetical protein
MRENFAHRGFVFSCAYQILEHFRQKLFGIPGAILLGQGKRNYQ